MSRSDAIGGFAEELGVHLETVKRWYRSGDLDYTRTPGGDLDYTRTPGGDRHIPTANSSASLVMLVTSQPH